MKSRLFGAIVALFVLTGTPVSATTINYGVNNIAGNTWEYTYAVSNDTLSVAIEEFTIFFDVGLYENLVAPSAPVDWDPLVIQPDPGLPDNGFYDALELTAVGIAPGNSVAGFSVQFDFLGAGTPGDQSFDIVNPITFGVIDSGVTRVSAVPLPAALWLFGSGILSLLGVVRTNGPKAGRA